MTPEDLEWLRNLRKDLLTVRKHYFVFIPEPGTWKYDFFKMLFEVQENMDAFIADKTR